MVPPPASAGAVNDTSTWPETFVGSPTNPVGAKAGPITSTGADSPGSLVDSPELVAVTENVYVLPGTNPDTTHDVAGTAGGTTGPTTHDPAGPGSGVGVGVGVGSGTGSVSEDDGEGDGEDDSDGDGEGEPESDGEGDGDGSRTSNACTS